MTQNQPWTKNYPPGVRWDADMPPSTMVKVFEDSVARHPSRICMNFMGRTWTYAETGKMAARFARGLQDLGVGRGSKIGLCLPNTPFYIVAYYGTLMAGAIVVNFNPLYGDRELEHQINDSQTEIMVTINVAQILPKVEKMLETTSMKRIICCDLADALPAVKGIGLRLVNIVKGLSGKPVLSPISEDAARISYKKILGKKGLPKPVEIRPTDLAVLQYTGGTTGIPKGAALSHANLTVNVQQANIWFGGGNAHIDMPERMLVVLPFFHVFSMTVQMNLSISRCAEIIMLPKFELHQTLDTITKEKPTMFAGVPTLYKAIIDCKNIDQYDLSSLKICMSGGAALNEPVMLGFKKLTGLELVEGYGLSETSPLAIANPVHGRKKVGSIGMPVPGTEIKIAPLAGSTGDVKEGEICLRGPQVMKEYWNRPDETEKVMDAEGFFHTGDVGYIDEDGYVFIVDRIKDMINASGMKVFSRKVEEAILQHPGISETSVIGIPDEYRGETVKAFLIMKQGQNMTKSELAAFLQDKLAPYEIPKIVEIREALPKTMIGKPDKKALMAEEKKKAEAKAA